MIFSIFINQSLIHSSPERISLATDGNRFKDPQPYIMQRESKLEVSVKSLSTEFSEKKKNIEDEAESL